MDDASLFLEETIRRALQTITVTVDDGKQVLIDRSIALLIPTIRARIDNAHQDALQATNIKLTNISEQQFKTVVGMLEQTINIYRYKQVQKDLSGAYINEKIVRYLTLHKEKLSKDLYAIFSYLNLPLFTSVFAAKLEESKTGLPFIMNLDEGQGIISVLTTDKALPLIQECIIPYLDLIEEQSLESPLRLILKNLKINESLNGESKPLITVSSDESLMAVLTSNSLKILDVKTEKCIKQLSMSLNVSYFYNEKNKQHIEWSNDNKFLLIKHYVGIVLVDTSTWKYIDVFDRYYA